MILPIRAFGDPVLRKVAKEINKDYPELGELIDNMFETMYSANGIGLAAPQIGLDLRLFVIDVTPLAEDEDYADIKDELAEFKKVFINAKILEESGEEWKFNEGCLSIPDVREDVKRKSTIVIEYYDENFVKHTETFSDIRARVIQHEYDHIEGILFTDHLSALKKKLVKGKLVKISQGDVSINYKMRFPK
ncbi:MULTISPECIES: peptide deformylase [Chryseobacterium]|uniref:Peptide deformylase n=2 Tax=Chryseobacterium TaxID=59732 RepID=A0A3M7LC50_9FLAO|nr:MULTISPECIES: peptide deformylase [Chryseobacterium]RMZ60333.1 peptide deformylase [Chryseobacterium nematophagum]RNA61360.1 peptide deformylase [Chryseobacterium nematophagum]CAA7386473.1 Peptide deformylase 1 [Chryseobacterium fistulae]